MTSGTRASTRVKVFCPAHFTRQDGGEQTFGTVVVINLGGFYLATPESVPEGEELEVAIALPGHPETFRTRARVVDSRPAGTSGSPVVGVGCAFVQPTEKLLAAILNLPAA